jgi:hypothetical protein
MAIHKIVCSCPLRVPLAKWTIVAANAVMLKTKCDVAVAVCTGKFKA